MRNTTDTMDLVLRAGEDGVLRLESPDVGEFTAAIPEGQALSPGAVAGTLLRLGRATDLVVPAGAYGTVTSSAPKRRVQPVGFGDLLYTLDPEGVAASGPAGEAASAALEGGALAIRAGQSGRVWRSPTPGTPPLCSAGDVLEPGAPVCVIEVMKTFSNVPYLAEGGLPARAKVVRWLVDDGSDVHQGDPMVQIEPA